MIRRTWISYVILGLVALSCKESTTIIESVNGLTDPSVMPGVIYTFPGANSTGPYDGFSTTFTVRFNKLMDLASLRHAIHFVSSVGDLYPDSSTVTINQGDVASITPVRTNLNLPFLWRVGRQYSLRIDSTAKDIFGNHLSAGFAMSFTPEPVFRVKSISPAPGALSAATASVLITFNAPVDTAMRSRVTITPPVPGLWHYQRFNSTENDSSQMLFQSASGFAEGIVYSVAIGPSATDKQGDPLVGGFASSFTNAGFGVTGTVPGDGSTNISTVPGEISVAFNDTLDLATVAGAFSITPVIPGQITFNRNLRQFFFTPAEEYLPETVYTVTIDTSIRATDHARLPRPYLFSFLTASSDVVNPVPSVTSTSPRNADTLVSSLTAVRISFATALDTASARAAFSIAPPVNGLISVETPGVITFSPIVPFEHSTQFTVSIATTLRSSQGVALPFPYAFSFTTEPFSVLVSSPPDGATHIATDLAAISLTVNDLIDSSTIHAAWSITPAVDGVLQLSSNLRTIVFAPTALLAPRTVYTVTVSTALKTTSGDALPAPRMFSFATGD